METHSGIEQSLALLSSFFSYRKIDFWLEAGTALAAHRDGKVFEWEHDIDIAIWKESAPDLHELSTFFKDEGFEVIIQKSLPFLDNLIQLKVTDKLGQEFFDIDIYLYSRWGGNAYMRWIQKPEGHGKLVKKKILLILRNLVNPMTPKWISRSNWIPRFMSKKLFDLYLAWHVKNSSCIYHRFPEQFFVELKEIIFYGVKVKIPLDTEGFLTHRYGSNWRKPDSQFNQTGKWKKSEARVLLPMSLLPLPIFDLSLIKYK